MPQKKAPPSRGNESTEPFPWEEAAHQTLESQGPHDAPRNYQFYGGGKAEVSLAGSFMATTELINPLIERAEKALAGLRLGVGAGIELDSGPDWIIALGFYKREKVWSLVVQTGDPENSAKWEEKPLRSASREVRLAALSKLPELEKQLVATAESQLRSALATVKTAEAYIADLEARAK